MNFQISRLKFDSNKLFAFQGDSGGGKFSQLEKNTLCNCFITTGLFIGDDTFHCGRTLIGIVSYGSANCSRGDPAVYTRVTSFLKWIDETMEANDKPVTKDENSEENKVENR